IDFAADLKLGLSVGPAKLLALALGVVIVLLLYRRIATLGRLTVALWIGVLGVLAWVLVEGGWHLNLQRVFETPADRPTGWDFARKLGTVTLLAMYSYL